MGLDSNESLVELVSLEPLWTPLVLILDSRQLKSDQKIEHPIQHGWQLLPPLLQPPLLLRPPFSQTLPPPCSSSKTESFPLCAPSSLLTEFTSYSTMRTMFP